MKKIPFFPRLSLLTAAASLLALSGLSCGEGSGAANPLDASATPSSTLALTARSVRFDKNTVVAIAGARISLTLVNDDGGTLHNVAVYRDKRGRDKVFSGETFSGSGSRDYAFVAPGPGTYYFRCDVHPDAMKGVFIAK